MATIHVDTSLMPAAMWNTHIACLTRLCEAAARGLSVTDVAGITGLAFRTALTPRVTPAGMYLGWAWEPTFRRWLSALGLDADVAVHETTLPGFHSWLDRQHLMIHDTLARGFPVMYWDNLGVALILGADDDGYFVSGVPAFTVHPEWHEQPQATSFCARLLQHDPAAKPPKPIHITHNELVSTIEPEALFIYLHGITRIAPEMAWHTGIRNACAELAGQIEYPRVRGGEYNAAPCFGTGAIAAWRNELKDGNVHGFGMIQAVQSLLEARQLALKYLLALETTCPELHRRRIKQAAQFTKRIIEHLRPAAMIFSVPFSPKEQMVSARWGRCREVLYQVQKTERTMARLLGGVIPEMQDD